MKRWNFRRVTVSRFGTTYVRTTSTLTIHRKPLHDDKVSELETERLIRKWERLR